MTLYDVIASQEAAHLRFAPCPNGPVTLGHLKGLLILDKIRNDFLESSKNASLNLRFDDNNKSELMIPAYYESFFEIISAYDIKIDNVNYAYDNLEQYRTVVDHLLKVKGAFVCECPTPTEIVANLPECTCELNKDLQNVNLKEPLKNVSIKFKSETNRPYVIYRCIKDANTGFLYNGPTIALQGPVDDYSQKRTIILRGRDLQPLTIRQKEIYEFLYGQKYPSVYYWGRINVWNSETKEKYSVSKSDLKESSELELPNLKAFYIRGYTPVAIKNWLLSYNFTKQDMAVDLIKLNYYQKRELQKPAEIENFDYRNDLETGYYKSYWSQHECRTTKRRNFYYWNSKYRILTEY